MRDSRRAGNIMVIVATSLVALLGFAGLAIDVGHAYKVKSELQHASDASALSATAELGQIYLPMSFTEQAQYDVGALDAQRIVQAAEQIAIQHKAGGNLVGLLTQDIEIGRWDADAGVLTTPSPRSNAVRVGAERSDDSNGAISTFLSQVVGVDSLSVKAGACAALTPLGVVPEGKLVLPVGISRMWFASLPDSCDQPIRFHPTGDLAGCAAWHTYDLQPANASTLSDILKGLADGSYSSPVVKVGQTLEFTGGTVASVFDDMKALYEIKRFDEAPFDEFEGVVPVHDWTDCSNPSGAMTVAGFASVIITGVRESPDKVIDAVVKCGTTVGGQGGGEDFGTRASIPALVE